MRMDMQRREFIAGLGGAAAAWPMVARAQQAGPPVIGFLDPTSLDQYKPFVTAFHSGLQEVGFIEGKTVTVQYRWAEGHYDRLPALATTRSTACSGPRCDRHYDGTCCSGGD
jgi:putative ABC transport system substrate-binding protein